jgi:hypothetical protein
MFICKYIRIIIDPAEINFPNTYTESILNDELTKIYHNNRFKYVDKILILKDNKIVGIYKRK